MKPDLEGRRVTLRSILESDAEDLFEIYSDQATMEFASDPAFETLETVHHMLGSVQRLELLGESLEWAVVCNKTSKVIGTCGLHSFSECGRRCEIGCLLNSSYWRQGYMSEALNLLLNHAKLKGLVEVAADIDEPNFRSVGLFKSLGFSLRGDGNYYLQLA